MTVLFGFLLLVSCLAIGRDGRVLPLHGFCTALCIAFCGQGPVAVAALVAALGGSLSAWMGLRRFAPERMDGTGVLSPVVMAAAGGMVLVFLLALSAVPGLPVLFAAAVVLIGLCGAALSVPLLQFAAMFCGVDGLFLLAGCVQSGLLLAAAVIVWGSLAVLGVWLLPRLAWLRTETPDDV